MIRLFLTILLLFVVSTAWAQNYGVSNPIPQEAPASVVLTNNLQPNAQPVVPPAPPAPPALPPPQATAAPDKPAVIITAQGTVLTDEQKRLVSQKLQEIPGVVVITNRIHVVGQINEAAGAASTNRGKTNGSRNYRTVPRTQN